MKYRASLDQGKDYFFKKKNNRVILDEHPRRFLSSEYNKEILNEGRTRHAKYLRFKRYQTDGRVTEKHDQV